MAVYNKRELLLFGACCVFLKHGAAFSNKCYFFCVTQEYSLRLRVFFLAIILMKRNLNL